MSLAPHQERVVTEKKELEDKISKLGAFIVGPKFVSLNATERSLLARQHTIMLAYQEVLHERIAAWPT